MVDVAVGAFDLDAVAVNSAADFCVAYFIELLRLL